MVLNEEQWIKELREKRIAYGISQGRLAVASGITREYLNKIESGKMKPSKELLETLHKELARFNPEAPLTMLFDYVKIRFPTLDIQHIIKDIYRRPYRQLHRLRFCTPAVFRRYGRKCN